MLRHKKHHALSFKPNYSTGGAQKTEDHWLEFFAFLFTKYFMFSWFRKNKSLLSQDIQDAVIATIAAAEKRSSGEIRVYVESHCAMVNPIDRSAAIFEQLNMHQTKERNGVLLYLALNDKQFAIVGDEGINQKVGGNDYWEFIAAKLKEHFKAGQIKEGICFCVTEIGMSLAKHYPEDGSAQINELPNEIVFGK
jgi:uncharacterized membrane protein